MSDGVVGDGIFQRVEKLEQDFAAYRRGMTRHLAAILEALLNPGSNPEDLARLLAKAGEAGEGETTQEANDLARVVQKLWQRMGDAEAEMARHKAANARSFGVLLEQVSGSESRVARLEQLPVSDSPVTYGKNSPACRLAAIFQGVDAAARGEGEAEAVQDAVEGRR